MHRDPHFLTARSGRGYVGENEVDCCRADALPLPRQVNRQVKQLRVAGGVSQGNDANDRDPGDDRQWLPVKVARPDIRLRQNDKGNRLMSSDETDLIS